MTTEPDPETVEQPTSHRDLKDIICGGVLVALGAALAVYVPLTHKMGTLFQIGGGFLPTVMGVLIAGFGILLIIPALFREGATPLIEWRPLLTILGSVSGFAITIEHLGLIAAIFVMTMVATFADNKLNFVQRMILAAALSVMAVVIFYFALDVPLPLLIWEF